jgi:uncharacterized protein (TIGR02421 family)
MVSTQEQKIVQALSKRIVKAQQKIRILDTIKWDDTVKTQFFKEKCKNLPKVDKDYYSQRPLPFDVSEKRLEFNLIIRDARHSLGEYSAATQLIKRQCEEYIQALALLDSRGTPDFSRISMALYGSPDDVFYVGGPKLSGLGASLFDVLTSLDCQLQSTADEKRHTAKEAQKLLQARLSQYFTHHPERVTVEVNDSMVADAAAGAETIKLNSHSRFSDRDIRYLEVHEGWVHVGTTLNGAEQPYCTFLSKGAPSSSVIQEGLAVLTEVITFSSYPGRLRKITNRVIALEKVLAGANFLDIYRYFVEVGLNEEDSYNHTVRVFRGSLPELGPFTKDLSYTKGFVLIYNFIRLCISQKKIDTIPLLFMGKIGLQDLPLLQELKTEQLLAPPMYLPPQFEDLAALSAWMSLSLYLNKFDMQEMKRVFYGLLI